jgi:glutamate N-acetyltransferase / amino-acid N-acetyltransferase
LKLPRGYRYAATYGGLRRDKGDDIALIVPDAAAHTAAVFTVNVVQAAPVRIAKRHLKSSNGKVAAVLVNAGNANCATRTGERVALASCNAVAKALKTKAKYVLPASTGVIGVELNPKLLIDAVPDLIARLSPDAFEAAARAIMTTDTRMKVASEEIRLTGNTVRVAGMTKGAGMIHPNMATTLGFVMTDAAIAPKYLREMLLGSINRTYSSLTVDGDMSTNDMVALLANGASGVKPNEKERRTVQELITYVMESLVRQIAADGEGARKLVIVHVLGFKYEDEARKVARSVANSLLVKTAIAGSDPNWGRILAAAGYSGVSFDPSNMDIDLQHVPVCRAGLAANFDEAGLKIKLDEPEVRIRVVLNGKGKAEAHSFTCDLTEDYIKINASYRT